MKKILLIFSLAFSVILASNTNTSAQISKQGKGAIIGGAGGAVVGGLIGHNVKGAVIGGALGAGGGYIIGNEARRRAAKKHRAAALAYRRAHPKHTEAYYRNKGYGL
jgi:uncharacterized protein YcfJ